MRLKNIILNYLINRSLLIFLIISLFFLFSNIIYAEYIPPENRGPTVPQDNNQFPLNNMELALNVQSSIRVTDSGPIYNNTIVDIEKLKVSTQFKKTEDIGQQSVVPSGYANIRGVATTYAYSDGKKFPLRGIKVELWEDAFIDQKIKTVYTKESTTDPEYGLSRDYNYIDSNNNLWINTNSDNAGYFDFGNVNVGASGKDFYIRIIFIGYSGADGLTEAGVEKLIIRDDNDHLPPLDEPPYFQGVTFHMDSGQDSGILIVSAPILGSSGLNDEAAHVYYDLWKTYAYFRDAIEYTHGKVDAYIDYGDKESPFVSTDEGYKINFNEWDNGYLTYEKTDSIIHEYSHSIQYGMRGGNLPLYTPCPSFDYCDSNTNKCHSNPGVGDCNHGRCDNPTSVDAIVEGWARYVPTSINLDNSYHWGASDIPENIDNDYGDEALCEEDEWTFGASLYDIWDDIGYGANYHVEWSDKIGDTFNSHDAERVLVFFNGFISDWGYSPQMYRIFCNHNIKYDTTTPPTPSPTAPSGCTADTTPTITNYAVNDAHSGVKKYQYRVGPSGAWQDVGQFGNETAFNPSLASSNTIYVKAIDYCGNEATGSVYVCIDTSSGSVSLS